MDAQIEESRRWRQVEQMLCLEQQVQQSIAETRKWLKELGYNHQRKNSADQSRCASNQSARLNSSRYTTGTASMESSSPEGGAGGGGGSSHRMLAGTSNSAANTTSNASSAYNMSRSLSTRYPPRKSTRIMSTPLDLDFKKSAKKK